MGQTLSLPKLTLLNEATPICTLVLAQPNSEESLFQLLLCSLHLVEKCKDLCLGIIKNIIKNGTQRRLTTINLFYPTTYWASCHIFMGTLTFA